MTSTMPHRSVHPIRIATWLRGRAENALSALLVAMFVAFLVQIAARYLLGIPVAWTIEVATLAWLWGVLWGAALVLRDDEEIRFDILYAAVPPAFRRAFDVVTGMTVVIVFGASLPAVADYVAFMRVETSAALGLRFDTVYSVYIVFSVAMIVRHGWIVWRAIRGPRDRTADIGPS